MPIKSAADIPRNAAQGSNFQYAAADYNNYLKNSIGSSSPNKVFAEAANNTPHTPTAFELEQQAVKDMLDFQVEQNKAAMDFTKEEARINREFQQNSADTAMRFSQEAAREDRSWQERMANTAYQRVVDDLRRAGLNPILAYTNGGAGTGGGSTANAFQAAGAQGTGYTSSGYKADYTGAMRNSAEAQLAEVKAALEGINSAANLIKAFLPGK